MSENYRMDRIREQERRRQQQSRNNQRRSRSYDRDIDQRRYEQDRMNDNYSRYSREYNRDRIDTRNRSNNRNVVDDRRYSHEPINNTYSRDRTPQRRNDDYRYQERSNIDSNRNYDREREYRLAERERIEREKERERIERIRQQDRNYNINQKERQERIQQLEQMNAANEEKKVESSNMVDVAKKKKDKGKILITILNILLGLAAIGIAAVGYIYGTGAKSRVQIYLIAEAIIVFLFIINGLRAIIKNKRIVEGIFLVLGVCIMITFMVLTIKRIFI